MVHREPSKREKSKIRGRPFPKGNKRGKLENSVLDASGHKSSAERGTLDLPTKSNVVEKESLLDIHSKESNIINIKPTLSDAVNNPTTEETKPVPDSQALELIEEIEFKNGENTLKITFKKKHNRMFRVQVFLNDTLEMRPATYSGATTAFAFWNLMKGSLKK